MDVVGRTSHPLPTAPGGAPGNAGGSGTLSPAQVARMRQAAQEFESIMIGQMLKSMRQASAHGKTLLSGTGKGIYQDMMDDEFSRAMSRGGGIGLADMLMKDLLRQAGGAKKASSPPGHGPMVRGAERERPQGGAR